MTLRVPIGLYLGMTLVVPLLNGARADGPFFRHAAVVLCVSACVLLVGSLWRRLRPPRSPGRLPDAPTGERPAAPASVLALH